MTINHNQCMASKAKTQLKRHEADLISELQKSQTEPRKRQRKSNTDDAIPNNLPSEVPRQTVTSPDVASTVEAWEATSDFGKTIPRSFLHFDTS
jgi:hypothetical protein